jgi:hypothetical protein
VVVGQRLCSPIVSPPIELKSDTFRSTERGRI